MISFDITTLAAELILGSRQEFSVREALTVRMIEAALTSVNDPEGSETELDELNWILDDEYQLHNPDQLIAHFAAHIRKEVKRHGWDSRLQLKLSFKKLGPHFHRGVIEMDLDATFARNLESVATCSDGPESVHELVDDNPSLESINELFKSSKPKPQRKSPLLSDRLGRTVRDPSGRGWS